MVFVVVLVFINSWQDRSCQNYLVPLLTLQWTWEHCEPLPGCRQLPALQHPQLLLATTCQAQAGRGEEGAQAVKWSHGQRAGRRGVRDVLPTPDVFRDPATLAQCWPEQHSRTGRPVEESVFFSVTQPGDTSVQLVAFSIPSSARGATLPSRERKARTKQHNPASKSSFRECGFN